MSKILLVAVVFVLALQLPFVCFEVGSLSCGLVSSTPE